MYSLREVVIGTDSYGIKASNMLNSEQYTVHCLGLSVSHDLIEVITSLVEPDYIILNCEYNHIWEVYQWVGY